MRRRDITTFKSTGWYKPLFLATSVASVSVGIWILRSGALAMWDRYSPEKSGAILPWSLAIPISLIGGFVVAILIMVQLELIYERWRDRKINEGDR